MWGRGFTLAVGALLLQACFEPATAGPAGQTAPTPAAQHVSASHPITLARPATSGRLRTTSKTPLGGEVAIACATCHAGGEKSLVARSGLTDGFHANIQIKHADLECRSCHVVDQPQMLQLSTGKKKPLAASLALCSQCHGPKRKAWDHGAHGGMRGYWDVSRGPRQRNDCITCHAAHEPAYPKVTPMPGPKDRRAHPRNRVGPLIEARLRGSESGVAH